MGIRVLGMLILEYGHRLSGFVWIMSSEAISLSHSQQSQLMGPGHPAQEKTKRRRNL